MKNIKKIINPGEMMKRQEVHINKGPPIWVQGCQG